MMIYGVAMLWCTATAVRAAIVLIRREAYITSWWEAGVAGTGRKFGRVRTAIKVVTMLGVAAACGLALAQVLPYPQPIYIVLGFIGVAAISELSAPKHKRR